jgi:hypothetical protein
MLLDAYDSLPKLAAQFRKHPRSTKRFIEENGGPAPLRIGRTPYWNREAVATWLKELEARNNKTRRGR